MSELLKARLTIVVGGFFREYYFLIFGTQTSVQSLTAYVRLLILQASELGSTEVLYSSLDWTAECYRENLWCPFHATNQTVLHQGLG